MRLSAEQRVAILLHEGLRNATGKTGLTFLRYSETPVVAVIDRQCAGESLPAVTKIARDVPIVASVAEALPYQPEVLVIGIAPSGGILPPAWQQEVRAAIQAGLSVVNGLHTPIAAFLEPSEQVLRPGQWIWDIRREPPGLGIASAKARSLSCQRILTVGTDMAVGKMSTGLELYHAAKRQGINAQFAATGQGGMMISGDGIPLDAIRVDFAAGAVEQLVLRLGQNCEVLFIEGQGSLLHPGSTATLPLMRGSQPTGLVLVHRPSQKHIRNFPEVPIPPLPPVISLYESVASGAGAFPEVKVKAIALNTFDLDEPTARSTIEQTKQTTGLPCTDVVRFGVEPILEAVLRA